MIMVSLGSVLAVAGAPPHLPPQAAAATKPSAAPAAMLVDITLERKQKDKVERMAPGHVFEPGDVVRLRLKSHYRGYLYVLDQGTSGKFSTVFPSTETGSNNSVQVDQEYLVPAVEEGWFEVDGPPGYDVLYFLLSPSPLATPPASSFTAPGPASSLKPRCNDEIFRARGECMDDSAGPAAVPAGKALPAPIDPLAHGASRDLIFVPEATGTVGVTSAPGTQGAQGEQGGANSAPVIYTFRLAHN